MFFATPVFALDDGIIAVVNDEIITLKDLRDHIQSTYVSLVAEGLSDEEIEQVMLDLEINGIQKLIEDKLILSKANKLGMEIREKMIKEKVDQIKRKYRSEQEFNDALITHGVTVSDIQKKVTEQMKITFVIEREVTTQIFVNPQEVTEYYENHLQDFQKPERIHLTSILVAFSDTEEKEATRQRAQKVLSLILDGKDFNEIAAQYSNAPHLGTVERGQILPEIEEIVFKLNNDDVSPLIEVDSGLYIFKVSGRAPTQIAALKEVKDGIYEKIFQQKFRQRFENWLTDLKKDAYIEIKN